MASNSSLWVVQRVTTFSILLLRWRRMVMVVVVVFVVDFFEDVEIVVEVVVKENEENWGYCVEDIKFADEGIARFDEDENFRFCGIPRSCIYNAINARRLPLAPLVYTLVRPPMTTTVVNNSVFRAFFEKQRLTGPNFIDWYRNLRIVLSVEDKLPFLEQPIPAMPVPPAGQVLLPDVLNTHTAWVKASKEIASLMLMTMDPDIQKNLEQLGAYDMLKELKTLYAQQAKQELLQTVREFHACTQEEGQSVSSYVLKMKIYIDNLERLGHAMTQNLAVSLILVSLRKEYDSFVQNYNIHGLGKTVTELHAMLKLHCGDVGHWKRNCPQYLAELLKNKKLSQGASTSGIFTIELYTFLNNTWVYDTGCGTHICITTQGLRGSRKLKPGALSLYVGDGHHATVEAIGTYHLCLPSGLVLVLHNCHYAPSITRGIISVSHLNGIFEIDWSNSNTNDCSMYAVSNKRAKINLDSSLLWHCRLGHISKKRIEKLQHDGLLNSTDIQSFEKCVSCMFEKMARKPYTHQVERAKDLLGLIHTPVCGPFRTLSRQGASYFVTFTDNCSRYGYVYLLKNKHEVFETFKVFQKEVENQLRKTIKSLCSDRGGEYMSQEFLDHLKDYGIIAHRTPPYVPQHNRVSERRNRTLLDMNAEFLENILMTQEASESLKDLEIIQEEDTSMSWGDLGKPANYKAELLDPESDKWLDAMNVKMQSMKDNEVWDLVDLPPNGKTVGSKWLFKKKTDMDGSSTINMYCDSIGAIAIAKDHGITKGARHFRAKVHYLRETIEMGDVRIEKVDTDDNLADPFTKALAFHKHSELTRKIGMIPASSLM
ncbi:retrotransposon protein, putative, ty1-copia subclass [Tanacetum coccineum]|uniref:Retrotransposon protein, putative, ty1-copia subclass n=1 Tax=Tanacetum coccineum TaxID=301880 RepID=A0ABQ4YCS5_9ASTR